MCGGSGSSNVVTNTNTGPWAQATPDVTNLLAQIEGQVGGPSYGGPTDIQRGAINTIQNNNAMLANNPAYNYGDKAGSIANFLTEGGGFYQQAALPQNAYNDYKTNLTPYATGANLDPRTAPGMADVLATIRNDVGQSVNSDFAGAGRFGSSYNATDLARGISQGEAVPLLNQYQKNQDIMMQANNGLLSGAGATAQQIAALTGAGIQAQGGGLQLGTQLPQIYNTPAEAELAAGQLGTDVTLGNLGNAESMLLPIAGLGTQGVSIQNGSYTQPFSQTFAQFMSPFKFNFGSTG